MLLLISKKTLLNRTYDEKYIKNLCSNIAERRSEKKIPKAPVSTFEPAGLVTNIVECRR
jgi:hypothetical protein